MSGPPVVAGYAPAAPPHQSGSPRRPRVLVLGANTFEDSMERHVVDGLNELGCEVGFAATRPGTRRFGPIIAGITLRLSRALLREPERRNEHSILRAASDFGPNLVLVILGSELSPRTVAQLRKLTGAPLVCWFQDAVTTMGRQYVLGAGYDIVFMKDRHLQRHFSQLIRATEFRYLPEAFNPAVHHPVTPTADEHRRLHCEVMIAGSLYYYRQHLLQHLDGRHVAIWGHRPGWLVDRVGDSFRGPPIHGREKAAAVCSARIALNTLHFAEIDGLNCRAFELAGYGAFQLVSDRPVLNEHFTTGLEVESFSSYQELRDKVDYYLRNPDRALEIASRGLERARQEHTYAHRLREILAHVNLTV